MKLHFKRDSTAKLKKKKPVLMSDFAEENHLEVQRLSMDHWNFSPTFFLLHQAEFVLQRKDLHSIISYI